MNEHEDQLGFYDASGFRRWLFRDRAHGGEQLGAKLSEYTGQQPLVLGIPCGGVPVAREVARRLHGELDVMVARKLPAPRQPSLAIGAVTADGDTLFNRDSVVQLGLSDHVIDVDRRAAIAAAERQEQRFRCNVPKLDPSGRVVILVDDGLATGATLRVAAQALRGRAARLVVAVPVGSTAGVAAIAHEVDEVLCLHCPEPFLAVGRHYRTFEDVTESMVETILTTDRRQRCAAVRH